MKTFEIRVTQPMIGYYYGWLNIEAEDRADALNKITAMSNEEIYELVDWEIGDEMYGKYEEINIQIDTLTEI